MCLEQLVFVLVWVAVQLDTCCPFYLLLRGRIFYVLGVVSLKPHAIHVLGIPGMHIVYKRRNINLDCLLTFSKHVAKHATYILKDTANVQTCTDMWKDSSTVHAMFDTCTHLLKCKFAKNSIMCVCACMCEMVHL